MSWKKYPIFKSKDNITSVSEIHLTGNHGILCAFYALDHNGKTLMIKHRFSLKSLYTTPDVVSILDTRKCFCVCCDNSSNTHLYYRDSLGCIRENIYDPNFAPIAVNLTLFEEDIYSIAVCCSQSGFMYAYTTCEKGYTVLKFKKEGSSEKIITFGIARNTPLAMHQNGTATEITWQEGNCFLSSVSRDGGLHFTKPKSGHFASSAALTAHNPNKKAGVPATLATTLIPSASGPANKNHRKFPYNKKISDTHPTNKEEYIMNRQNFTENRFYQHENADSFKTGATDKHETHTFSHGSLNADCMPEEIISHFKTIEKAVIRLTEDTKTICELLNGIVNLKNKSEILSVIPQTSKENIEIKLSEKDVGEIDEENVKLFESKF